MNKPTVVIVPADGHSGSPFGLMKLEPWQLADGGTYHPRQSKSHQVIWEQFAEVAELIRNKFRKYRKIVVFDGDAVEGNHHHTVQMITPRVEEQEGMHIAAMEWFLNRIRFG